MSLFRHITNSPKIWCHVGILLFLSRLPWHAALALIMIFSSMMQFSPQKWSPKEKKTFCEGKDWTLKNMSQLSKWKCHNWLRIWWTFVSKLTTYYILESQHWELCNTMGKEKGAGQCFYWPCLGRQENCVQIHYRV